MPSKLPSNSPIDRLRRARRIDLREFGRLVGSSDPEQLVNADPRKLDSETLSKLSEVLGVPQFVFYLNHDLSVEPLPRDFRTEGNRAVLHSLNTLKAIYKIQQEAQFITDISKEMRVNVTGVPNKRYDPEKDSPEQVARGIAS